MGACISSVQQVSHSSIESHKNSQMGSKATNDFVMASPPISEKPSLLVTRPMPEELAVKYRLSSAKFRDFGSKEQVFFETQSWLESDGDDEFFSVNGDLTPSYTPSWGSTPVNRSLSVAPPQPPSEDTANGYKLTLSPAKRRKSLSELFKEDSDEDDASQNMSDSEDAADEEKTKLDTHLPKSMKSTPPASELNSYQNSAELSASGDMKARKAKSQKSSAQRCLPKLFSAYNSPKKTMIPAV